MSNFSKNSSVALLPFITFLTMSKVGFAAENTQVQRNPVKITSEIECTTSNPKPVLLSKQRVSVTYKKEISKNKPITTTETLNFSDGMIIKIQQTGCSDLHAVISIKFGKKCSDTIRCSIDALNALAFDPNGFFLDQNRVKQITKLLKEKTKQISKSKNASVFCLDQMDDECITDLKAEISKSELTLTYIDRP